MPRALFPWTDHRIETLTTLWNQDVPVSEISKELGNIGKNSVIGKANRLGLKSRARGVEKGTVRKALFDPATKPLSRSSFDNLIFDFAGVVADMCDAVDLEEAALAVGVQPRRGQWLFDRLCSIVGLDHPDAPIYS